MKKFSLFGRRRPEQPENPASLAPLASLFRPGAGLAPPHLAGRDKELAELDVIKEELLAKRPPKSDVILRGPRGAGKTALLASFQEDLLATNKIQVLSIPAKAIRNREYLIRRIAPASWLEARLPVLNGGRIGTPGTHADFDMNRLVNEMSIQEALEARIKENPFVFLLDEAHELDRELGGEMLNAFQEVRKGNGGAAALLLAGTPGLLRHLGGMGASFWERHQKIPVGLIDRERAKDALTVPLRRYGVSFEADALHRVVGESCHYPYFLQLWGEALTVQLSKSGDKTIAMTHVEAAKPVVDKERDVFYDERRAELGRAEEYLMDVALAVGRAYPEGEPSPAPLSFLQLKAAIPPELLPSGVTMQKAIDDLEDRGYVWRMEGDQHIPGIPSLMDYLQKTMTPDCSPGCSGESPP